MKLIAHRGWSAGGGENTLGAFARAAGDARISGVELDVRHAADGATLVVSHDPPGRRDTLTLDAALTYLSTTDLELYVELKEAGLAAAVTEKLVARKVADRSVVFAFAEVASSFPWESARPVRLGVIVIYPWRLERAMRKWAPDVLMFGWDDRAWTRIAFRAWWSVFSLERCARRYQVPIVAGIAQRELDIDWLARQRVAATVADFDRLAPA